MMCNLDIPPDELLRHVLCCDCSLILTLAFVHVLLSGGESEEQQRLRRQKRSERLANQDGDSDGSEEWDNKGVFARGCRPAATLGAGGSEGSMRDAMQFK